MLYCAAFGFLFCCFFGFFCSSYKCLVINTTELCIAKRYKEKESIRHKVKGMKFKKTKQELKRFICSSSSSCDILLL